VATTATGLVYNQTNDTEFRAWGSAVSAAIATAGFTQTADTGQVDWSTVTRPSAGTTPHYEIWAFADTLQATRPVMMKVSYGSGSSATRPWMSVELARATDGAGTLTGTTTGPLVSSYADFSPATDTITSYIAGGGNWLTMCLWPGGSTGGGTGSALVLVIDRTRDGTGAATGDGVLLAGGPMVTSGYCSQYVLPLWSTGAAIALSYPPCYVGSPTTATQGLDVSFFPWTPVTPKLHPPILACFSYWNADISRNTDVTFTVSGTSHTYKTLGNWGNWASANQQNGASLAIRYE